MGLDAPKPTDFHDGRFKQLSPFGGEVIRELIGQDLLRSNNRPIQTRQGCHGFAARCEVVYNSHRGIPGYSGRISR